MNTENDQRSEQKGLLQDKPSLQARQKMVPYKALFRYATKADKVLIGLGAVASAANGASFPLFAVIFGTMTDAFSKGECDPMLDAAAEAAMWFCILAAGTLVCSFVMFSTYIISGERQSIKIRQEYFTAILRQEVGWFDQINPNELTTKVADETYDVQGAIQEKLGTFIMTFSTFIASFIVGYATGWQLAIVITASLPCLAISIIIVTTVVRASMRATQESYSHAAAESEQALNSVKTVKMLDGEDFECAKYTQLLQYAAKTTIKYNLYNGMAIGSIFALMIWTYALGFWYGSKLISDQTINDNNGDVYSAGDVMTIFFAILMGSFSLGQAGPCFQAFGKGQVAGVNIFDVIDRKPRIVSKPNAIKIQNFTGKIEINEAEFSYPARANIQILKKASLHIPAGKKVALVGESGCGKSTIMQLVERFYDVDSGSVLIGDERINIKELDIDHYRSQIGMVGQEPVLFATSIKENLLYGKPDATDNEIVDALKKANAWEFVSGLEKGWDTYVGIGGGQLSGGQKQRIAIARAILKKPKLLLLDEATSALDRTNEKLIQKTLDEVSKGITTIVIAHRLSTIQNADLIYVFAEGQVIEQGTHEELMKLNGKYMALAKNQITHHHHNTITKPNDELQQEKQKQIEDEESSSSESVADQMKKSVNQIDPEKLVNNAIQGFNDIKMMVKSQTQTDLDKVPEQIKTNEIFPRLFAMNKPERPYFITGVISAAINGCIFPCFALFFSEIIATLVQSNPNLFAGQSESFKAAKEEEVRDTGNRVCLYFLLLGFAFLIFQSLENFFFSVVAENLTAKLRSETFRKLLRMPIPFFDKPENNAGTLTARLSVDCKIVQSLTSTIIGFKIQNISSLISGMIIAFTASWQLSLIVIGTAPISFIGRKMRTQFMGSLSSQADPSYKESSNIIMESVTNIRTVYSFGNQQIMTDKFNKKVSKPLETNNKTGCVAGFAFGFSQMQTFLINAFIFYMGALLVCYADLDVQDMFQAIFGITFATVGGSRDSHFVGDMEKGQKAAKNIFVLLDSVDEFQIEEQTKCKKLKTPITGQIEAKNLTFKYPSREKNVFESLSVTIPAGKKVAFVGPSGCGKSTIMQMLMRFYDPDDGVILLDGINIKDYDIRYLRRQLAIVSQEPVLFNGTIAENIKYNKVDATFEDIVRVSKTANAYNFIINNEFEEADQEAKKDTGTGFEKKVGPKGSQISGGQKQRIAIARAILRESSILLLDEATSALDATAEQLVQESLDKFQQNRTTLSIAHRISTIKDSDIIYVFELGKIVEQGMYQELVAKKGFFFRLEQGIAQEEKHAK